MSIGRDEGKDDGKDGGINRFSRSENSTQSPGTKAGDSRLYFHNNNSQC